MLWPARLRPLPLKNSPVNRIAFARFVSIVGHPFTFILLLLLVPFWRQNPAGALRVSCVVAAMALVPLGLFYRHRVATGRWSTVDASDPNERPILYISIFAVLLPMTLYFLLVERSSSLVRGSSAIGCMLAAAAALNHWIKLSGHLAFAGFAGLVLG